MSEYLLKDILKELALDKQVAENFQAKSESDDLIRGVSIGRLGMIEQVIAEIKDICEMHDVDVEKLGIGV